MKLKEKYKDDITEIMSKINSNGGDLWTTEDHNIAKGSPFSTRDAALMLIELGFTKKDKLIKEIAELIFSTQRDDGRFRISKTGAIYPCHTIGSLRVLCYMGYSNDKRLTTTIEHLLSIQEKDGGWLCNKFSFGRGPETKHSNPGPSLEALDALRFTNTDKIKKEIAKALEFLLWHWEVKKPIGPCHFGMGSLFHKTEYPFFRYNLFYYTYVLSFYEKAINDKRFKEAFTLLKSKLNNGEIRIENPNRLLANLDFCRKDHTSLLATKRYNEIVKNIEH